jgi:uncharacterized protein with PIN domain
MVIDTSALLAILLEEPEGEPQMPSRATARVAIPPG